MCVFVYTSWILAQWCTPPYLLVSIMLPYSFILQISYAQGKEFAEKVNAIFFETSALKATNIEEIFVEVGE